MFSDDREINERIDGFPFYTKTQIKNIVFDYCMVTIPIKRILDEAIELGISSNKLIPIQVLDIPYFSLKKYIDIKESNITIISSNCWAGICYHRLGLPFNSPTINMFFNRSEFNRFVANLDYYLEQPLQLVEYRYERNLKRDYPVAKIDDITLHFNHYETYEGAASCWERRKKRINREHILVVSSTTDKNDAIEFDKLPYKNKIIFVPNECDTGLKSCFPVNYIDNNSGVSIGMYINGTVSGSLSMIDIFALLNGEEKYKRTGIIHLIQ